MTYTNRYMGVYDVPELHDNGSLPSHAWPGGYEIAYLTRGSSTLCAKCANKQVEENLAWLDVALPMNAELAANFAGHLPDEEMIGYMTMDSTDTCANCDECGRWIVAYCEVDDASGVVTHSEHCDYGRVEVGRES